MIDNILNKGVAEAIEMNSLQAKLASGKKLRVKLGVDPTSPDIHLGHMVVVNKLRDFQNLGHTVILIIGDYTARIGDPSGKKKTRPILTEENIKYNAKTYLDQVGKVLDMSKVEVVNNSKWFSKVSFAEWLSLLSQFTVAQIMERDDFSNRFKGGIDIGMHELIYPAMQAYDSVMIKADVEIGGTDQKFNMLAGRDLQRKMGQMPQEVITVPLLVGIDGKEKMSKSLGNYIGVTDEPNEMYGKVMSIPDGLIVNYFALATDISEGGLKIVEKELKDGANPRDVKARLAYLVVELYYDSLRAQNAADYFDSTFRDKKIPDEMPEYVLKDFCGTIVDLMVNIDPSMSKTSARKLVEQGGVKVDAIVIKEIQEDLKLKNGAVLQIGKRKFYRMVVSS